MVSKEFKRGILVSFLTPVFTLWGGGYIARHVWRWVIVPLDLERSFGAICAHYRCRVIHRTITKCVRDLSSRGKGSSCLTKLFGGLSYKKIQRYNNSPPYVMARWLPQQIPPLNFLDGVGTSAIELHKISNAIDLKWHSLPKLQIIEHLHMTILAYQHFQPSWIFILVKCIIKLA